MVLQKQFTDRSDPGVVENHRCLSQTLQLDGWVRMGEY